MSKLSEVLVRHREQDAAQTDADIEAVLGTEAGRRVLMTLLQRGGAWRRTGYCDGDAVRLAYETGRRDGAVDLLAECNRVDAGMVAKAMAEKNGRDGKRCEEIRAARAEDAIGD